jgi:hypothetical protein
MNRKQGIGRKVMDYIAMTSYSRNMISKALIIARDSPLQIYAFEPMSMRY